MSIRHCIAGVVLVVIGGLAVNAYQGTGSGPSIDQQIATKSRQVQQHERELVTLQDELRRLQLSQAEGAGYAAPQPVRDAGGEGNTNQLKDIARAVDRVKIADFEGQLRLLQADMQAMRNKTGTLALADEPKKQKQDQPKQIVNLDTAMEIELKGNLASKTEQLQDLQREFIKIAEELKSLRHMLDNPQPVPEQPWRKAIITPSPVGRYQYVAHSHFGVIIDTTTGHCWSQHDGQWKDLGSPKALVPTARNEPTLAPPGPSPLDPPTLPPKP